MPIFVLLGEIYVTLSLNEQVKQNSVVLKNNAYYVAKCFLRPAGWDHYLELKTNCITFMTVGKTP